MVAGRDFLVARFPFEKITSLAGKHIRTTRKTFLYTILQIQDKDKRNRQQKYVRNGTAPPEGGSVMSKP